MIRLHQIHKSYKVGSTLVPALKGIDLAIERGEIFGVIGHSGAGKSTLIRCINLLERPTSGEVFIDGVEITKLDSRKLQEQRRKIGMIFQHFNLLSSATVADNIAFPLTLAKMPSAEIKRRVKELVALVGLEGHEHKYPAQLSGGQKQRVGIARALANDPHVLLCDEATSALDPQTTNSILTLLLDINRKLGLTIVLITHEMHVIRSICDRLAVIQDGEIVESGKVAHVFLKPKHPTTREFIEQVENSAELLAAVSKEKAAGRRTIVRMTFIGEMTYEPVLYRAMRDTDTSFAILQGTISRLKDIPYGQMVVELEGEEPQIAKAVSYLRESGVEVEFL
ncbi:methionine ABC transporter ATP-binding protein [Gorillibacterium massiliense]|uniref:methionine ABC transporter ATP-binding protein n=1 Tax=Gorillibacterium massiliense TaxID=1280390 RepID=UPI0004B7AC61|nr:methionine ABC transporter ATP-binding protein [Gorillibacterium massiliense]